MTGPEWAFKKKTMEKALQYAESNKKAFLEGLKGLLRYESLSADPAKKEPLLACARAEADHFRRIGLENVSLLETPGNPIVYGDWLHAPGKPTLLIYGHYDVQPADPFDLWKTPPFEGTEKEGWLYGRGADDNKGQHFIHLCAIESYLKTVGKLPVNVKLILEGEEEFGSKGSTEYIKENAKKLSCDAVMISDTAWHSEEHPAIQYSLRGLTAMEVRFYGPERDLHSGVYGGFAPNPLVVMTQVLGKLKDENNHVTVPGFYDDVLPMDPKEREELSKIPWSDKDLLRQMGTSEMILEKGFSSLECNWFRPAMDINGIGGGYQGQGGKTVIPTYGFAKITIRLVANQDPEKISKSVVDFIRAQTPSAIRVEFDLHGGERAFYIDPKDSYLQKTKKAFEKAFGKPFLLVREGASIPLVAVIQRVLKTPVVLAGIGLPDDCIHSPNEKLSLANFYGGIRAAIHAYQEYAE